jgi:hypothetical protein
MRQSRPLDPQRVAAVVGDSGGADVAARDGAVLWQVIVGDHALLDGGGCGLQRVGGGQLTREAALGRRR